MMTPEQRRVKIGKVLKQRMKKSSKFVIQEQSTDGIRKMSVKFSNAHITLQPSRVADLWKKAEALLSGPNLVVPAAGNPSARQVASINRANDITPPHFVYSKKSKQGIEVNCDCPVYRSTPNVCQHSLAAAEDYGCLDKKCKDQRT